MASKKNEIKNNNVESDNKKEKKGVLKFFAKMFLIFIVIDLAMQLVLGIVPLTIETFKYGSEIIAELFYGLLALVVMLLFNNSYVFTNKSEKFGKSLLLAVPLIALSIITLVQNVSTLETFKIGNFINVFIYCIFIGITEEFLCRGWIQNEFIERYGDTKKNIITSIICASLIFGLMHVTNLFFTEQNVLETLLQVINATSIGFLFGIIYYKTKNIWSVAFLHFFYDFSIFIGEMNQVKDCTYGTPTTSIIIFDSIMVILLIVLWIVSSMLVLKKCNFPDKRASITKDRDFYMICVPVIVFILAINAFPVSNLVEEYDDYYVCYEYNKMDDLINYTTHYPHYNNYTISYNSETSSLLMGENDLEELITINNYNFVISKDNDGKVFVTNLNTGSKIDLGFKASAYGLEVIENEDCYIIVIQVDDLESTIYYSDFISKENISNDDEFLNQIKESFKKYDLPLIEQLGYVTIGETDYKYPFFYSTNNDLFIIKNAELFILGE